MDFNSLLSIKEEGFEGFETFDFLWESKLASVPEAQGVYMVLRNEKGSPIFLEQSRAGEYKGEDRSKPIASLKGAWISNTLVLYIGKAGGAGITQKLKGRLEKFVKTGYRGKAARGGGIRIWQLEGSTEFQLCWKHVSNQEPEEYENELIRDFICQYGRKPFANGRL